MTKIAQASSSEYFSAWGEPGNQRRTPNHDDGELNITDYTNFTICLRWKNTSLARKASDLAVRIVHNPKVGYSQNNGASPRDTLRKELLSAKWIPENISNPCNCDCSSFISTICQYCGLNVDDSMYTGNQIKMMMATKAFVQYPITNTFKFQVGDIVWRQGHTAIVVSTDDDFDMVTTATVYMCEQPVTGKTIKALPPGTGVKLVAEYPWYQITDGKNTGWMSGKYLEKN